MTGAAPGFTHPQWGGDTMSKISEGIIVVCEHCGGTLSAGCHGAEDVLRRLVRIYNNEGTGPIDMHEACQYIALLDKSRHLEAPR